MSTGSSYANQSAASRPITAPGATAQSFKTYASAAFDEPINDDDVPSVIEHLAIVIGAHCLFLVTAVAIVGAAIILCSRVS